MIDCRYQTDYVRGTIRNAINLPLDLGLGDFKKKIETISRETELVISCQSAGCHFSDYTATMLFAEGFKTFKCTETDTLIGRHDKSRKLETLS